MLHVRSSPGTAESRWMTGTGTYRRVEHGADRVDIGAEEEELADLAHDLLVVHVDLARLADDLGDVLGLLYRRRDEVLELDACLSGRRG